ncbi:MAG TPA: polymorphic toxin type 28 domain-containing protein, partial [Myxococcota bacterium]|nr:polymorphic toxin type 28 domain-containing protein [Myxococcota bacterium]
VEPPFEVQAVKPKTRGKAERQLGSKGMSEPVALTREELARVRTWESARNSYLKRWREVDTSPYPKEVAELLGPEGSVRKAMTPDDLAAVIKEKRGVEIAKKEGGYFDHHKEYWQASKNLKARIAAIQDFLKKFPAESEEGMILREKLGDLSRLLDLYESTI